MQLSNLLGQFAIPSLKLILSGNRWEPVTATISQLDVGNAFVANRTAKGSIGRISVLFTEIKAHMQDVANLECLPAKTQIVSVARHP